MGRGQGPSTTKNVATNGSTAMHSQTPGNLFPSPKLKGNCTFVTEGTTVRNDEAEGDPGVKLKGEGDMEPPADEDVEASGRVG